METGTSLLKELGNDLDAFWNILTSPHNVKQRINYHMPRTPLLGMNLR